MLLINKPEPLITHFVIKCQSEYSGIGGLARNLQLHTFSLLLLSSPSPFSSYEGKVYENDLEESRSNYFQDIKKNLIRSQS